MWVDREDVTTLTCRWEFQGEVTKGRSAECLFGSFQVFLVAAYSKPAEIPQTPAVSNRLFYFSLFKGMENFFPPYAKCYFGKMSGTSDHRQILIIPHIGSESQVVL